MLKLIKVLRAEITLTSSSIKVLQSNYYARVYPGLGAEERLSVPTGADLEAHYSPTAQLYASRKIRLFKNGAPK